MNIGAFAKRTFFFFFCQARLFQRKYARAPLHQLQTLREPGAPQEPSTHAMHHGKTEYGTAALVFRAPKQKGKGGARAGTTLNKHNAHKRRTHQY